MTDGSGSLQNRFDVFAQCKLHLSFGLLETACLNGDGWVFAPAVPAVISQPELAFNPQTRRQTKGYSAGSQD